MVAYQKYQKKYRVSNDLVHYVRRVMTRSYHSFALRKEGDTCYCACNLTAKQFHQIIMRARCEKESDETGTFVVTKQERDNAYLYSCLQAGANQYANRAVVVMEE